MSMKMWSAPSELVQISSVQLVDLVRFALQNKVVLGIQGQSGVGKSTSIRKVCAELEYNLTEIVLGGFLPEDLTGIPKAVERDGKVVVDYVLPHWLAGLLTPIPGQFLPEPHVLFIDELTHANEQVQATIMRWFNRDGHGGLFFYENVLFVCAWNSVEQGGINPLLPPLLERIPLQVELVLTTKDFIAQAASFGIHPSVTEYIKSYPQVLNPRKAHQLSNLLKNKAPSVAFSALIGEESADHFLDFIARKPVLPTWQEITASPQSALIPKDTATIIQTLNLIIAGIGETSDEQAIKSACIYARRLPLEFQIQLDAQITEELATKLVTSPSLLRFSIVVSKESQE